MLAAGLPLLGGRFLSRFCLGLCLGNRGRGCRGRGIQDAFQLFLRFFFADAVDRRCRGV